MLVRALLGVISVGFLQGAAPKVDITSVSPSLHFGPSCVDRIAEIVINLDRDPLPPINEIQVSSRWSAIAVFQKSGKLESRILSITAVRPVVANGRSTYPLSGAVALDISPALEEFPLRLIVSLDFLNGSAQVWTPKKIIPEASRKICTLPVSLPNADLAATSSASTSTGSKYRCRFDELGFFESQKAAEDKVRLTGAWTSGFSTRPYYSIDALIEVPICPMETMNIDIGGTIKTAERASIDPDSFTAYVSLKPKSEKRFSATSKSYYGWGVKGGGEFSRKDEFENIVFVPQLTLGYGSYKSTPEGRLRYSYGAEFTPSLEVGHNRRTKNARSGYGSIGRIAPSLTAIILFPVRNSSRNISLRSTYSPRILLSPEPFTDQRIWIAHETPFKSLAAGTRHYWLNELSAELTPLVTFSVKSEFGSVPPVFNIIDYRMTTGLTMKWKWQKK